MVASSPVFVPRRKLEIWKLVALKASHFWTLDRVWHTSIAKSTVQVLMLWMSRSLSI